VFSKLTINSVVFLLLTAFTVAVAIYFRNPLLVYTAVFMVVTNAVLFIWAQYSVRGMSVVRRHPSSGMATHSLTVELDLTNHKPPDRYGTLGFDLHRELTPGQDYTPTAFLVAPAGITVSAEYQVTPPRRGQFKLGPFYLYGGDPFGFYKCWRKVEEVTEITIVPNPVAFSFTRPASASLLKQDELETVAVAGDSTEFMGVREYMEGESLRRIHWPTTARLGKLISRQYELNVAASISALVMVDEQMRLGSIVENPLEYSLRMVAGLGHATCVERYHLSYLALKGTDYDTLAGSGHSFYQELSLYLARLAGAGPIAWSSQAKLILNYLPANSCLIVFCAELSEATKQHFTRLAARFRSLAVVTFDRKSFEVERRISAPGPRMSFGEGYLSFEVQYGDDLSRVLGQVLARTSMIRSQV